MMAFIVDSFDVVTHFCRHNSDGILIRAVTRMCAPRVEMARNQ